MGPGRIAAVFLLLAAIVPAARAEESAVQTAAAVGAIDREFARRAAEEGVPAAFRDYMDPDQGLAFTGGGKPARGAAAIYAAMTALNPPGSSMRWVPLSAWGSKGGDMGVTTGDWAVSMKGKPTPVVTGRYVTVWHKDAQGHWKGLIDIGESDAKPQQNEATRN